MKRTWIGAAVCLTLATACTEADKPQAATTVAPTTAAPADTTPPADTATDDTSATGDTTPADTTPADTTPASDGSVIGSFGGQEWFRGVAPYTATPADESQEPIVIGMINQENSPVGSYPEIRAAAEAAVAWVNAELGGVNGRPLVLKSCITSLSTEQSQACAQQLVQDGAVAVMSGIDITASGSLPVLEQNGVPAISVIPTTLAELRSNSDFSFSGSITGAYVAFASHAHDQGSDSMAIAYGDFESFSVPAKEYGAKVAENLGMKVTLIPFGIATTDYLPVVQAALDSGASSITIAAADAACVPIITSLHDLGFDGQLYMVGACAAEQILAQIPDDIQAEVIFNSEGPIGEVTEGQMFTAATEKYATEPAGGAGTVGFRAAMNLWAAMVDLQGEVTPQALIEQLRSAVDQPSFWGHPYTCDGQQVPGFPAMCSPQQTLFRTPVDGGSQEDVSGGWIDVPSLLAAIAA